MPVLRVVVRGHSSSTGVSVCAPCTIQGGSFSGVRVKMEPRNAGSDMLTGLLRGCSKNSTVPKGVVEVIKITIINKCPQGAAKLGVFCVGGGNIWCKSKNQPDGDESVCSSTSCWWFCSSLTADDASVGKWVEAHIHLLISINTNRRPKKKKRIWRFVLLVAFQIMQIICVFSFMKISFSKGKKKSTLPTRCGCLNLCLLM